MGALGLLAALTLILMPAGHAAAPASAAAPVGVTGPADAGTDRLAQMRAGEIPLRVGTDATFPPFEFTDAKGKMLGFDIDLVHLLAKKVGIKEVQFTQLAFGNIVPAIQAKQIDMGASAIYISDARAKVVDFSDIYYPGGLAIFVADKNDSIKSLADLAGKKVAVQVGTKSVEWLKQNAPQAELVTVQTNEQMFSSVKLGQADAVVTGAPAGQYFVAQQGGLKEVGSRLTNENYGYAFSKDDAPLRKAFNTALSQAKDDGSYAALTDKWFGKKAQEGAKTDRGLFNLSSITDSWRQLLSGLGVTVEVVVLSMLLSICLGMIGGLLRLSRLAPLRAIGATYVSVIRGTPFVVQMFFIYFGLPQLGVQLNPMVAGIISLGLYSGSYVTEIVRGAVQSIDRGQMEAARSCGMSHASAMRHVVVPQAFLRMLPVLGNEAVSLTKNSALVSFITIHELFLVGQTIISRTFDALTIYLFIGLIYYLLTNTIGFGASRLEKRLAVYV